MVQVQGGFKEVYVGRCTGRLGYLLWLGESGNERLR